MINRLKQKVEHWRELPEPERFRVASLLTWSGGAIIVVLWLTVLLPFQLYLSREKNPESKVQGSTTRIASPSPTLSPSPSP